MGQLVKLQDYISRYEKGMYNYPSRFIRMKRKQWDHLKASWEAGIWPPGDKDPGMDTMDLAGKWKERGSLFDRLSGLFRKKSGITISEKDFEGNETTPIRSAPETLDQLKQQFLDDIFRVQILWASSTLTEQSFVDSSFYKEEQLKFLLQRLPDTFLLLYKPIFLLKKAPVQGESILITPTEIFVLLFLEEEKGTVFVGSDGRFWERRLGDRKGKLVNPLITLNRTETIIRGIFHNQGIDFPVRKLIISRNGYIDYPSAPYGVILVDERSFGEWLAQIRTLYSPIKHLQLKAAKSILNFCKTSSMARTEWESI